MNDALLDKNPVITICAPRNSGKSFLIKQILTTFMTHWDNIVIFCPTLKFNNDYEELGERGKNVQIYRISDFGPEEVNGIFAQHEETMARCVERERELKRAKKKKTTIRTVDAHGAEVVEEKVLEELECPRTLVVFDDCIDSGVLHFHGVVDKYAERGRHINISCIISSQRISAVSRSIRINSDLFLTFSPYSIKEFEQFADQFVPKRMKRAFLQNSDRLFDEPYHFVFLDNHERQHKRKLKHSRADRFVRDQYQLVFDVLQEK